MKKIEQAYISYRIPVSIWDNDEAFEKLFRYFAENKCAEEFAFFTNDNHTPPPLDLIIPRLERLAKRIKFVQNMGFRAGVNQLCTLGHATENVGFSAQGGRLFTNINGAKCPGNFCPTDLTWRENYIKIVYQKIASMSPDFIWVDDDLRLLGHSSPWDIGCFCDECLERVGNFLGFSGTREELIAFFEIDDTKLQRERREHFIKYNRELMNELASFIERVVHLENPKVIIGQMDCYSSYCGLDYSGRVAAFSGPDKTEVWWRPGGGFYNDFTPRELIKKANMLGITVAMLPDSVRVIEAELESFNYQRADKSKFFTALEGQLYASCGCTGVAYNLFGDRRSTNLVEATPWLEALTDSRDFLDTIVKGNQRVHTVGMFNGMNENAFLANNYQLDNFLSMPRDDRKSSITSQLPLLGLPIAFTAQDAQLYVINCNAVVAMSDEEILTMLGRGVYLDGEALEVLQYRGFGKYTGFEIIEKIYEDAIEELVDHRLNPAGECRIRNARQSFWREAAYSLRPLTAQSQVLARLINYTDQEIGCCTMGAFENELGGRIVVATYYPWWSMGYPFKVAQIKNIMRYLSFDSLSAYTLGVEPIAIWVRDFPDNHCKISLLNSSMDTVDKLQLLVKTSHTELLLNRLNSRTELVKSIKVDGTYQLFELPLLSAWELVYLTTEAIK